MSETRNDLHRSLGDRWAGLLRRRYGARNTAKLVASAFEVEVRTAQGWLSGQAPHSRHIDRARQLHGAVAIAELFAAESAWAATLELLALIDATEERIRAFRRRLAESG